MEIEAYLYENNEFDKPLNKNLDSKNTLVLCFGSSNYEVVKDGFKEIFSTFPNSIIVGNSTSGEIYQDELYDDSVSFAVIKFEKTNIKVCEVNTNNPNDSFEAGEKISKELDSNDLKGIFILSDGLNVNGSQLTKGINKYLKDVIVTGGLAGDGDKFEQTWVLSNNEFKSNVIVAIGFYGNNINIAYGSQGGWVKFGIDRKITASKGNILYELDNQPALKIYKSYLGEDAADLPASGLLYPLMIQEENSNETKVRTILAVDEENNSITFAGDMPLNAKAMFMKASFSQLIQGANKASTTLDLKNYKNEPAINIAISCVGRRLVLGQKTEDEIEAVFDRFGGNVDQIGYYSYGEISPVSDGTCDLHNQTMTLTFIWEG